MSSLQVLNTINFHGLFNWVCLDKNTALTDDEPLSSNSSSTTFNVDSTLLYEHFFADFGPLNLGQLHRFCKLLNSKLEEATTQHKQLSFATSNHPHKRSNSIYLVCSWFLIYKQNSVALAYQPFFGLVPAPVPFRDAAFSICTYSLSVIDVLKGVSKSLAQERFNFATFNPDLYDRMDRIEHGDCTWIIPGKLMAFSGPQAQKREISPGVFTLSIDEYIPLFKKYGVTGVIRFNKKIYDRQVLISGGINHYDLYYEDGGNPTEEIAQRFLQICEQEKGAVAVHCKAGLGRTGTNIGNYMIKHYGYTANEVIGWCRVCRPGSIVGPQQNYEADAEAKFLREGENYRRMMHSSPKNTSDSTERPSRFLTRSPSPSPEKDALALNNFNVTTNINNTSITSPVKHRARPKTTSRIGTPTTLTNNKSDNKLDQLASSPTNISGSTRRLTTTKTKNNTSDNSTQRTVMRSSSHRVNNATSAN